MPAATRSKKPTKTTQKKKNSNDHADGGKPSAAKQPEEPHQAQEEREDQPRSPSPQEQEVDDHTGTTPMEVETLRITQKLSQSALLENPLEFLAGALSGIDLPVGALNSEKE